MNEYDQWDSYLSKNQRVVDEIIGCYVTFLLTGYTIEVAKKLCLDDSKCKVGTIKGYLRVVNKFYQDNRLPEPWDSKDVESEINILLKSQESFEKEPARRSPLHPYAIAKMMELANASDPLGFQACVWDFTGLGRFGGFRLQEFAMDAKHVVKLYILPDGSSVVRCFTNKNFIARGEQNVRVAEPLSNRRKVKSLGTVFEVQKNRMNGQEIDHARLPVEHVKYCPVELGLNILSRAKYLDYSEPNDPLCVYKDESGVTCFLTGEDITTYYRDITRTVLPNTSDEELKLVSTHSLRVTACVLLHEANKDGTYIKLRLRWKSDCFEIYLRNTKKITAQHALALEESHQQMAAFALDASGLNQIDEVVFAEGNLNLEMDELEDED